MNEPTSRTRTENDTVAELAKEAASFPIQIESGESDLLLTKDGKTLSLERYQPAPNRPRATVQLTEPASFIVYVIAHADGGSHLFGTTTASGGDFTAMAPARDGASTPRSSPSSRPRNGCAGLTRTIRT